MFGLDQTLVGASHVQQLRAQARRDADARQIAPRSTLRRLREAHRSR